MKGLPLDSAKLHTSRRSVYAITFGILNSQIASVRLADRGSKNRLVNALSAGGL